MSKRVSPLIALRELGYDLDHPCRGHIMVETGLRTRWFKHYAFRYRLRDGKVFCRCGQIRSAYKQPMSGLWIFCVFPGVDA